MKPYRVVEDLEKALAEYTGAPYVTCVSSCSMALLLCLKLFQPQTIMLPKHTYVSVPCSVKLAGHEIEWEDYDWSGHYKLSPLPIWDSARRFTSHMYMAGEMQCVSFASSKILGIEQGGAVLHDDADTDLWLKRMRFDGRTPNIDPAEDTFDMIGYHCPLPPGVAAQLLLKLSFLPKDNPNLADYPYPDLSLHPAFCKHEWVRRRDGRRCHKCEHVEFGVLA